MATPKIDPEVESLEQMLYRAGTAKDLGNTISDKGTSTEDRLRSYDSLAHLLTDHIADDTMRNDVYGRHHDKMLDSTDKARHYANSVTRSTLQSAAPLYEKHRNTIKEQVLSALRAEVNGAEGMPGASFAVAKYLLGLFDDDIPALDQAGADRYAQQDEARALGLPYDITARGNIAQYGRRHKISIIQRIVAKKFLKEGKSNKVSLDEKAVSEFMEDIHVGAQMYFNYQQIEEAKKAEAAKKKK